jgi:hypothetical protein
MRSPCDAYSGRSLTVQPVPRSHHLSCGAPAGRVAVGETQDADADHRAPSAFRQAFM